MSIIVHSTETLQLTGIQYRIEDLINTVGNRKGKWFTSLHLMKGYYQVQMAGDSKIKTAFTCHLGLFHYCHMPFGLTNAPAMFQRLMNKLFCENEWNFVLGRHLGGFHYNGGAYRSCEKSVGLSG